MSLETRIIIFGIGVLLVLIGIFPEGPDEPELSHQIYCDMVQLYKDTKGEAGWPAYQGTKYCPAK